MKKCLLKRTPKTICVLMLIFAMLITVMPQGAYGDTDNLNSEKKDINNELEDIDWLMKLADSELEEKRQQAETYLNDLTAAEQSLSENQEELDRVTQMYETLLSDLETTEEKYDQLYKLAGVRLNIAYQTRNQGTVDALLENLDLMSAMRKTEYGINLANKDAELLLELDIMKEELEKKRSLVYEDKMVVATKQAGLDADAAALRDALQNTQDEVRSIESMYLELERQEDELLEQSKEIERQIREYEEQKAAEEKKRKEAEEKAKAEAKAEGKTDVNDQSGNAANSGGTISSSVTWMWPSPGHTEISSPFGNRLHPVYGYWKMHNGVDINAPFGAYTVATAAGTVISSEYQSGYGYTVIIDHGGGIYSLYAHSSSLLVKSGEWVEQGQNIAIVGSTGTATGPHLHFEIRVNGKPTDPMNYVSNS